MASLTLKHRVALWTGYDAVKKAFSLGIVSLGFPIVLDQAFKSEPGKAEGIMAVAMLFGNVAVALTAPSIGRTADRHGVSRLFFPLNLLTAVTIVAMSYTIHLHPYWAAVLFTVSFICFQHSVGLYDSLLTQIAAPGERERLSFTAWAWGFCGGVAVLAIIAVRGQLNRSALFALASALAVAFAAAGIGLRRVGLPGQASLSLINPQRWSHQAMRLLVLTFLVYNGIDTLTVFVPLFVTRDLRIGTASLLLLLLLMQVVAIPATLLMGALAAKVGSLVLLQGSLVVWAIICLLMAAARTFAEALVIFIMTGIVLGCSKALLRGAMAEIAPTLRASELFGWSTTLMRGAAVVGPALFAAVVHATDSMRTAFLSHTIFFLLALVSVHRLTSPIAHE